MSSTDRTRRRKVFGRVGALLGLLGLFELVRFLWPISYAPAALASLVPADADVFVAVRDIGSMLDRLRATRAFERAAEAPESGDHLRDIPDWLIELIGKECAWAVCRGDTDGPPAVILLGWVGRKHRHLDPLAHQLQRLPDSEYGIEDRRYRRRRISRVTWDEFPEGTVADYTVVHGVLLFTLSWGEGAIERLIDAYADGARLSLAESPVWHDAWSRAAHTEGFRGYGFVRSGDDSRSVAYLQLSENGGDIALQAHIPVERRANRPEPPGTEDPIFGTLPADAFAVAWSRVDVFASVVEWIGSLVRPWEFLGIAAPPPLKQQRWMGPRVIGCLPRWEPISENIPVRAPQVIVGGDLESLGGGKTAFRALARRLADAAGWTVAVGSCGATSWPALCVQTADVNLDKRLGISELPAAVFPDGQWRYASRRGTMLAVAHADESLPLAVRERLAHHEAALWVDPPALVDTVRYGVGIYSTVQFWLQATGQRSGPELPPAEILPWLDAAGALRSALVTVDSGKQYLSLNLEIGLRDIHPENPATTSQ